MFKKTVSCFVLAAFCFQVTGCYNTRRVSIQDSEAVEEADKVIVRTRDRKQYTLSQVRIEYPKLTGIQKSRLEYNWPQSVTLDIGDLDSVTVKNISAGKTIAASIGSVVLIGAAVIGVILLTKESCPLVYAYDGMEKALEGELYSGAIFRCIERRDFLRLDRMKPSGGRCIIELSNEADETQYTDELTLLAVDHPTGTEVLPDCGGVIRTITDPVLPLSAADGRGRDALDLVRRPDGRVWNADPFRRDAKRDEDLQDGLTLRFPRPSGAGQAKLVVRIGGTWWADYFLKDMMTLFGNEQAAWNSSMDGNPEAATRAELFMKRQGLALNVSVMREGAWQEAGYFYPTGPVAFQDELMEIPMDGVGDELSVRLSGGVLFWMIDCVAVDFSDDTAVRILELPPASAISLDGADILDRLAASDDRYFVMPKTGDRARIEYAVPPEKTQMERSFILRSEGYYTIHPPSSGPPDMARWMEFRKDPYGFSRNALTRFWQRCGYRPES